MTKTLTIYGANYEISNIDLVKEVNTMVKAFNGLNKSTWQYAYACYNVIEKKLYQDDFKNIDDFAKALGTNKSAMSKYYNGVKCYLEIFKGRYTEEQMTVSKCYLISTLQDDLYNFLSWLPKETQLDLITIRQLEELIKKFKDMMKGTERTETEETETTETEETDNINYVDAILEDGFLMVTIRNKVYQIPLNDLEEYKIA